MQYSIHKVNIMKTQLKIKKLVKILFLLAVLFSSVLSSTTALAASPDGANTLAPVAVATDPAACGQSIKACCDTNSASTTGDKPSDCGFIKRINDLITFLSVIVGIACALGIIIGGIEYSMSGGDPKRAASGKDHITKAVIAVVLYGFLYFFLQFIVPGGFLNG